MSFQNLQPGPYWKKERFITRVSCLDEGDAVCRSAPMIDPPPLLGDKHFKALYRGRLLGSNYRVATEHDHENCRKESLPCQKTLLLRQVASHWKNEISNSKDDEPAVRECERSFLSLIDCGDDEGDDEDTNQQELLHSLQSNDPSWNPYQFYSIPSSGSHFYSLYYEKCARGTETILPEATGIQPTLKNFCQNANDTKKDHIVSPYQDVDRSNKTSPALIGNTVGLSDLPRWTWDSQKKICQAEYSSFTPADSDNCGVATSLPSRPGIPFEKRFSGKKSVGDLLDSDDEAERCLPSSLRNLSPVGLALDNKFSDDDEVEARTAYQPRDHSHSALCTKSNRSDSRRRETRLPLPACLPKLKRAHDEVQRPIGRQTFVVTPPIESHSVEDAPAKTIPKTIPQNRVSPFAAVRTGGRVGYTSAFRAKPFLHSDRGSAQLSSSRLDTTEGIQETSRSTTQNVQEAVPKLFEPYQPVVGRERQAPIGFCGHSSTSPFRLVSDIKQEAFKAIDPPATLEKSGTSPDHHQIGKKVKSWDHFDPWEVPGTSYDSKEIASAKAFASDSEATSRSEMTTPSPLTAPSAFLDSISEDISTDSREGACENPSQVVSPFCPPDRDLPWLAEGERIPESSHHHPIPTATARWNMSPAQGSWNESINHPRRMAVSGQWSGVNRASTSAFDVPSKRSSEGGKEGRTEMPFNDKARL